MIWSCSLSLAVGFLLVVAAALHSAPPEKPQRLDAHGDPLEFAQVQALRLPKSGRGTAQQRNGTNTNDLGEFRLARLEPGKYLVFVMPQRRQMFFGPASICSRVTCVSAAGS